MLYLSAGHGSAAGMVQASRGRWVDSFQSHTTQLGTA